MKINIIKINLDKSNEELTRLANILGEKPKNLIADRKNFKTFFFCRDNDYNFLLIAQIRRGQYDIEYVNQNYLKFLDDVNTDTFEKEVKDFTKYNKYIMGEDVDIEEADKNRLDQLELSKLDENGNRIKLGRSGKIELEKQEKLIFDNLDLDTILDKISNTGFNSLTKLEKKFLDKYSKES